MSLLFSGKGMKYLVGNKERSHLIYHYVKKPQNGTHVLDSPYSRALTNFDHMIILNYHTRNHNFSYFKKCSINHPKILFRLGRNRL